MTARIRVRLRLVGKADKMLTAAKQLGDKTIIRDVAPQVGILDGTPPRPLMKLFPPLKTGTAAAFDELRFIERRLADAQLEAIKTTFREANELCKAVANERVKRVFRKAAELFGQEGAGQWLDSPQSRFEKMSRRDFLLKGGPDHGLLLELDRISATNSTGGQASNNNSNSS